MMPLEDYTDGPVTAAIEQNNLDLLYAAAELGGKIVVRLDDIGWVISKPVWPSFLLEPRFNEDRLREIGSCIDLRQLPPFMKVGPRHRLEKLRHHRRNLLITHDIDLIDTTMKRVDVEGT